MAEVNLKTRVQVNRHLSTEWANSDFILKAGEIGLETDTLKFKFGDGVKTWSQLSYANSNESLNFNNISNCITKIPQDIILELKEGTLTLKAGSKVYKPNGELVNISQDKSQKTNYNADCLCFVNLAYNRLDNHAKNLCFSQEDTPPTYGQVWYKPSTKEIFVKSSTTDWTLANYSLPIATTTATTEGITVVNQVFNGFGYLATTFFCLPGIEGLIPNGRNEDGSLNNIKFKTTTVLSETRDEAGLGIYTRFLKLSSNYFSAAMASNCYYDQINNYNYEKKELKKEIFAGILNAVDGKIVSIIPKTCFQSIDYFEFNDLKNDLDNKVDLTLNQTITGLKTIDNNFKLLTPWKKTDSTLDRDTWRYYYFYDTNNIPLGALSMGKRATDGQLEIKFGFEFSEASYTGIGLSYNLSNNNVKTMCPHPVSTSNTNEIATTYWVNNKISSISGTSIGTLIAFAGDTPPAGYLKCDGAAISRTTYANLFKVISTKYGSGDGSKTFNLPNFINKTFWGGSTSGANLEAGLPNINGNCSIWTGNSKNGTGALYATPTSTQGLGNNVYSVCGTLDFDASRSNDIYGKSTTVQPPALQTIICIKY